MWLTLPVAAARLEWPEEELYLALQHLREHRDPAGEGRLRRRVLMDGEWQRIEYHQEDIDEAVALVAAQRLGFGR